MKYRLLLLSGLLFLLSVSVPLVGLASAFIGLEPLVAGRSFAEGRVVTIVDGYTSCYLIDVGEGRFVLVDGCNDPDGIAIQNALEPRGISIEDLEAVFLTHAHPDHTGVLTGHPYLAVFALESTVPQLDGTGSFHGPIPRMMGVSDLSLTQVRTVEDGQAVAIGDTTIEVFAVPGHTAGSAAFLAHGVLMLGDNAAWKPDTLVGAPWIFSDDCSQNQSSLKALAERLRPRASEVQWLAPSHSGPAAGLAPLTSAAR